MWKNENRLIEINYLLNSICLATKNLEKELYEVKENYSKPVYNL